MKKVLIAIAVVLVLALAAGGLYYHLTYLHIDGQRYRRDTTELNLSGQTLTDPLAYARLTGLKKLDLRGTGISCEEYDALREALPSCEIDWLVPFQGSFYPVDTHALTIDSLAPEDIPLLARFPGLISVDATACGELDLLLQLKNAFPGCQVTYNVPLGEDLLPQDITMIHLGDHTLAQLEAALPYLQEVTYVDASGCSDYDGILRLSQQYPACVFYYTVDIGGMQFGCGTTKLVVQDPDAQALMESLPYLPKTELVWLEGELPENDAIHALQTAFPDTQFIWDFDLFGVSVNSLSTEIDLSGIPLESAAQVQDSLKYFYQLRRVEMCDCGIPNEDMDTLCQNNPEIRFIWTVDVGRHIRLRTDATYLMPYQYGTKLTDKDVGNLKYCVDMICIDFGHSEVSDISFVAYMPHMKYLLLGDTRVSDLTPCTGLQELEFVELFLTNVTDYSPLVSCPNLRDLNISYSLPSDVDTLCQMKQLKNLWMKGYWWPDGKAQLREALPDATIVFSTPGEASATDHGWRELDNYFAMRDLLGMFYMKG